MSEQRKVQEKTPGRITTWQQSDRGFLITGLLKVAFMAAGVTGVGVVTDVNVIVRAVVAVVFLTLGSWWAIKAWQKRISNRGAMESILAVFPADGSPPYVAQAAPQGAWPGFEGLDLATVCLGNPFGRWWLWAPGRGVANPYGAKIGYPDAKGPIVAALDIGNGQYAGLGGDDVVTLLADLQDVAGKGVA